MPDWDLFPNRTERPRSGWIELQVEQRSERLALSSYELGVNSALVGRLHARHPKGVSLEFSPAHPLLEWAQHPPRPPLIKTEGNIQLIQSDAQTVRVREAPESETDVWQQSHVAVPGLASPLPHWNDLLLLDERELAQSGVDQAHGLRFQALVTALLVGIGHVLRDELASVRYIGPTRDLHPRTTIETGTPASPCWADGSAAWTYLHNNARRDLIHEVSNWLAQEDRLDTGYALQTQRILEVPEDTPIVSLVREYQQLREEFGTTEGGINLDKWADRQAKNFIDSIRRQVNIHLREAHARVRADQVARELLQGFSVEKLAARIRTPEKEDIFASVKPEWRNILDRAFSSLQEKYRSLRALIVKMEQRDFTSAEFTELAAAMTARPLKRELQLVTRKAGLPVRPSDIGVGVSQILPVVVAALDPDRCGITAIEQPELHLHPRIQVELGDLFAHQFDKGGFLIETHSEHLLLRFMRRMRQTSDGTLPDGAPEVRPENIAVYFVEIDPNADQTLIREMPLNERGELVEAWPGGFFEEDLREIF